MSLELRSDNANTITSAMVEKAALEGAVTKEDLNGLKSKLEDDAVSVKSPAKGGAGAALTPKKADKDTSEAKALVQDVIKALNKDDIDIDALKDQLKAAMKLL